jgi:hypothetical protein
VHNIWGAKGGVGKEYRGVYDFLRCQKEGSLLFYVLEMRERMGERESRGKSPDF